MSMQVIPFSFENLSIRVVIINDVSYFGARDVAVALGYADPSQAYNIHCKCLKLLSSVKLTELGWINPNPRGEYVMPESDVYRLIIKSNKPEAERFERWVFEDVLPTIRQTGGYGYGAALPSQASQASPEPSVAALALADSPYPRLHDQLNKALTLLTRPTSQMIKQVAFAQAQQLCGQLGITAMAGQSLPESFGQHYGKLSVDEQVLTFIERRRQHGVSPNDLRTLCWSFRKLNKLDRDTLLQRLLDQGQVVMVPVDKKRPRGRYPMPIFVATQFADMSA